jgi:hypothetical protein
MEKIGIITVDSIKNYGNKLQNYALEQILQSQGFEVNTLITPNEKKPKKIVDKIKTFRSMSNKKKQLEAKKIIKKKIYGKTIKKKINVFKTFSKYYLNEKKFNIENEEKYDWFIAGSDQIWNPINHGKPADFLNFTKSNKKISFAPSFGISKIPSQYKKNYKKWLSDFAHLSVREKEGVNIIRELIGKHAELLVDPTMLLDIEKWKLLSKKSENKPMKKYILVYVLGDKTYQMKKMIKKIKKDKNMDVVKIADIEEKKYYIEGPREFINYFEDAEIVLTDSFHGAIFSILFEKPFVIYDRIGGFSSMNSRINTLLNKFNFESRLAEKINEKDIFTIDFSHVESILEKERKKSIKYLKKALNIHDET